VLCAHTQLAAIEADLSIGRVNAIHQNDDIKIPRRVDRRLHRSEWVLLTPVTVCVMAQRGHKETSAKGSIHKQ
jgi:hypothetical protein